jgi:hypothetical protein
MWMDLQRACREAHRVLALGGVLVAIEPDYGGLIEHPSEIATRDLWLTTLEQAGADPLVGRKLPQALSEIGFTVHVELLDRLAPPSPLRYRLLADLPLTDQQQRQLQQSQATESALGTDRAVVHLPMFLVAAAK